MDHPSGHPNPLSTQFQEPRQLSIDEVLDVDRAKCPAVTIYDRRLVRKLPHLFTEELMNGRDFRKMVLRDNFPIPSDPFREGYCLGNDISYWLNGLVSYLKVMNTTQRLGLQPDSILDFGAASGRVVRHFRNQLDGVSVWAADINPNHVRWLTTHLPGKLRAVVAGEIPGLPIADNSLDLICAFSVFTHIDKTEMSWLAEMRRIMRPGGLCYFTIHNDDTWQAISRLGPENRLIKSMLKTPSFTFQQLQQPIPKGKTVYHFAKEGLYRSQVFHSNCYVREVWSQFFEILEIQPCSHQSQSVVVMAKPR